MMPESKTPEEKTPVYKADLRKLALQAYGAPWRIFERVKGENSLNEETYCERFLKELEGEGQGLPEGIVRRKAYALAQIGILKDTMLQTRDYLHELGVPGAGCLFEGRLAELETVKEHALGEYDMGLWHEIGGAWNNAKAEIGKFPLLG